MNRLGKIGPANSFHNLLQITWERCCVKYNYLFLSKAVLRVQLIKHFGRKKMLTECYKLVENSRKRDKTVR